MHIAEGFLPPLHAAGWALASAPFAVAGFRSLTEAGSPEETSAARLRLAGAGAFVFLLTALKLPSLTGSSSHPTGVGLAAGLAGVRRTYVVCLLVLLFQALLLAHGGLGTLGANFFSMGVVGGLTALGVSAAARRVFKTWRPVVFWSAVIADLATYACTSLQLALAYPDPAGGVGAALVKFLGVFAVTQVPLALAEGFVSVAVMEILRGQVPGFAVESESGRKEEVR